MVDYAIAVDTDVNGFGMTVTSPLQDYALEVNGAIAGFGLSAAVKQDFSIAIAPGLVFGLSAAVAQDHALEPPDLGLLFGMDLAPQQDLLFGSLDDGMEIALSFGLAVGGFRRAALTIPPSKQSTVVSILGTGETPMLLDGATLEQGSTHILQVSSRGTRLGLYEFEFAAYTAPASPASAVPLFRKDKDSGLNILAVTVDTTPTPANIPAEASELMVGQIVLEPADTLLLAEGGQLWYRLLARQVALGEVYAIAEGWFRVAAALS